MANVEAFPLYWPEHVPRTVRPARSRFGVVGLGQARDDLYHELRLLGARDLVLSTNIPLRNDGLFRANSDRRSFGGDQSAGVAAYFTHPKRGDLCMACDRWDNVACNLRALKLTVAAMRGIARWGTSDMVDAAFAGFKALPGPGTADAWVHPWWVVLGVTREAGLDVIEEHARILSRDLHPDKPGGDATAFRRVRAALEAARKERGA